MWHYTDCEKTLVYSMSAETRCHGIAMLNVSWEHAHKLFTALCMLLNDH